MTKKVLISTLITSVLIASTLRSASSASAASCTRTEALTEGPYYSTNTPVRSNIVSGQVGTKTTLAITVIDTSCKPVKGVRVDIWHANAAGKYSAVEGDTQNFLRGTQTTNSRGQATFTTIYPGWYPGRTMHVHFKIWKNGEQVLTSQFFTSDKVNSKIYANGAYAARGNQDTPLAADRIYTGLRNPAALNLTVKIASTITVSGRVVIS